MTEYEMASLANELLTTATNLTSAYFSISSAFIVGAYVGAHRLNRTMVAIVVGLFLLWSLSLISQAGAVTRNYYGLLAQIRESAKSSGAFAWYHPQLMPSEYLEFRPGAIFISLLVVMLASIFFFFYCRRVNRKAETVVEAPKV